MMMMMMMMIKKRTNISSIISKLSREREREKKMFE